MSKAEELASQSERIADARLEDDAYEWSVDADVQLRMCAAELRRLSAEVESLRSERTAWRVTAENAEKQLEDLKASIGEPVEWNSPDDTERAKGLVWLRENGAIFLGYYFEQPFKEYRDSDGFYVGQQDEEAYWAKHEDGEPCDPDGWQELKPTLYAIKEVK